MGGKCWRFFTRTTWLQQGQRDLGSAPKKPTHHIPSSHFPQDAEAVWKAVLSALVLLALAVAGLIILLLIRPSSTYSIITAAIRRASLLQCFRSGLKDRKVRCASTGL